MEQPNPQTDELNILSEDNTDFIAIALKSWLIALRNSRFRCLVSDLPQLNCLKCQQGEEHT